MRNKVSSRNRKKRNAGLSLVELVICIAIFSIVVLALFRSFVDSARVNTSLNNKRAVEVTTENLMEAIKGSTVDELLQQFQLGTKVEEFKLLPLTQDSVAIANSVNRRAWGSVETILASTEKSSDYQYSFSIDHVTIDHKTYDVLIELDGKEAYDSKESGAKGKETYNQYQLPVLNELDNSKVAMIHTMESINGKNPDEQALQQFVDAHNELVSEEENYNASICDAHGNVKPGMTKRTAASTYGSYIVSEDQYSYMTKTIKVTMETLVDGRTCVRAMASYVFDGEKLPMKSGYSILDQTITIPLFEQTFAKSMNGVYLLYSTGKSVKAETIELLNCMKTKKAGSESEWIPKTAELYLVRQDNGESRIGERLHVKKNPSSTGGMQLYTDMVKDTDYILDNFESGTDTVGKEVKQKDAIGYIYKVKISVYAYDRANRWSSYNKRYELESATIESYE